MHFSERKGVLFEPLNIFIGISRSARLQGFEKDLKLTGQQFPTVIAILYVGYGTLITVNLPGCH